MTIGSRTLWAGRAMLKARLTLAKKGEPLNSLPKFTLHCYEQHKRGLEKLACIILFSFRYSTENRYATETLHAKIIAPKQRLHITVHIQLRCPKL